MPLFDFRCSCGNTFEARVRSPEDPARCPVCHQQESVRLPSAPAGVHFKGTGFYATDNPRK